MSFLESPVFPKCPSFGYTSTPQYSVTITRSASGHERRNRNWARPLLRFDCTVGPRAEEDIQELLEFYHAVGGAEVGFRFNDGVDYKTCFVNETRTMMDQVLEPNDDSPEVYQLTKGYTAGTRTQLRVIYKPIQGTVLVSNNGVLRTEGLDYVIDYATGRMTIDFSPGVVRWGGHFDVPVRFDSEFPVELVDKKIQSVQFALAEIRDPVDED